MNSAPLFVLFYGKINRNLFHRDLIAIWYGVKGKKVCGTRYCLAIDPIRKIDLYDLTKIKWEGPMT